MPRKPQAVLVPKSRRIGHNQGGFRHGHHKVKGVWIGVFSLKNIIKVNFTKVIRSKEMVLSWKSKALFFFLIFIGVELIYNVLLVSGIHQSESVIHIHISTLFYISPDC